MCGTGTGTGAALGPHPAVVALQAALRVIAACQTVRAIRVRYVEKWVHSGTVADAWVPW